MPSLSCESYVCDPRPNYPLLITAKRYWVPKLASNTPEALTLIFAHGTGHHKEQWEPTIEDLYEQLGRAGNGSAVAIREAWSIDCPNHGDAAVLNEQTLKWGYSVFSWEEYARAVHIFLTGLGTGVDINFSQRNLVGVGHSMGAAALILAGTFTPKLSFKSLVLVEPMIFPQDPHGASSKLTGFLTQSAEKRRDIFPSREEALAWLQSRPGYKTWDSRVLRAFVDHGLRDLPTSDYPDKKEGVTLKCPRVHEASCYRDHTNIGRVRAYNYLVSLCAAVPVHIMYGEIDDYISNDVRNYVLTRGAQDKYASHRLIEGSGHLVSLSPTLSRVPQTRPRALAEAIWAVLNQESACKNKAKSRL
ncbi:hypothetical protein AcW1_002487 [Taiwanofungus camphoratus]|nr:hypothetical protein AcW1_002487 [Antrodia cinnamomea]